MGGGKGTANQKLVPQNSQPHTSCDLNAWEHADVLRQFPPFLCVTRYCHKANSTSTIPKFYEQDQVTLLLPPTSSKLINI